MGSVLLGVFHGDPLRPATDTAVAGPDRWSTTGSRAVVFPSIGSNPTNVAQPNTAIVDNAATIPHKHMRRGTLMV